MAKQSGIHQLRGKVGEHSYYRQSGVTSGLVRSINQGMSARVKTSEAYANTRLNNAEFGQACKIAARTLSQIVPKFRPMFLAFSQSKLAKAVLELIKDDSTSAWGQRNIKTSVAFDSVLAAANTLEKVNFDDHYNVSLDESDETDVSIDFDLQDVSYLESIGADKVIIRVISAVEYVGAFNTSANKYADSVSRTWARQSGVVNTSITTTTIDIQKGRDIGMSAAYKSGVLIVVAMPARVDAANQDHILQEHCTFKMYPYTMRTA